MKLTTPEDMQSVPQSLIENALEAFEERFKKEEPLRTHYHLVITGELPRVVCDEVENAYISAGWKYARCRTSSENGERPGLTGLILKMTEE